MGKDVQSPRKDKTALKFSAEFACRGDQVEFEIKEDLTMEQRKMAAEALFAAALDLARTS